MATTTATRMTFINLPIRDLAASRAFFEKLGFTFNEKFSDRTVGCMVIAEGSTYAMLHEPESFKRFTNRPIHDPTQATALMLAISAESREAVDQLADAAEAAGARPATEPQDYGFMYYRTFYDLDGHHWEVTWMDPKAAEQGPPDMA
jgi:hypothetical protein